MEDRSTLAGGLRPAFDESLSRAYPVHPERRRGGLASEPPSYAARALPSRPTPT